jgi:hypothetical protein
LEQSKKACDSIVCVHQEADDELHVEGFTWFARVIAFYKHCPPGSLGADVSPTDIAHLEWYSYPTREEDRYNPLTGGFIVRKEVYNDKQGNYWLCTGLKDTNMALAPSIAKPGYWEVLHGDSDFISRIY